MISSDPLRPVLDMALKHKSEFIHAAAFSALINLLLLAPAIYMLQVYDRVLTSGNEMTLYMLSVMVIALLFLMGFLEWIRSQVMVRIGGAFDEQITEKVFSASAAHQITTGQNNATVLLNDTQTLRNFMTGSAVFAFFDAPWVIVYLLLLFSFNALLGGVALVGAALLFLLAFANDLWVKKPLTQASKKSDESMKQAESYISKANTAKSLGMLGVLQRRWQDNYQYGRQQQILANERSGLLVAMGRFLRVLLQSLILGLGAWLALQGDITPGMMIAGTILIGRMLSPVEQLVSSMRQWEGVKRSANRLNTLLVTYPPEKEKLQLPEPTGKLVVEGATVLPPNAQKPTLTSINMTINAGEMLGVIGSSGSGKSSLAKLLSGVWQPRLGRVRLDDADLQQWQSQQLGSHIGYLPQNVNLFAGTIADNISRFGDRNDEQIIAAAKLAGVHEMIVGLTQGYDTILGDNGSGLSGGEQQRIGFARALYGSPKLLILDEPNSNLDDAGEAALMLALKTLKQSKTTVVLVTHRRAVLNAMDRILILDNGMVKACSTKQQVLDVMQQASNAVKTTAHMPLAV
ncbi:type I secretion system permease/ATPase [Pseudomonas sp. HK3]|jgi:ATP-binding cassette subfamily C exporter for protease/lipase